MSGRRVPSRPVRGLRLQVVRAGAEERVRAKAKAKAKVKTEDGAEAEEADMCL